MSDDAPADAQPKAESASKPQRSWKRWFWDTVIWGRPADREPPETFGLAVKENLEAFIFAVVLVMVVRHFALTPFRIPTSSMEPTLLGNERVNDRLFVNRWIYSFQPIKRFDVCVFLYPLNQGKHFIKRVVGLPGDELAIAHGDVWVDGKLIRKRIENPRAQRALWIPVFRQGRQPIEAGRRWSYDEQTVSASAQAIALEGGEAPAMLRRKDVDLGYRRTGERTWISRSDLLANDLRIEAEVTLPAAGTLHLELVNGGERFVAELPVGEGEGVVVHDGTDGRSGKQVTLESKISPLPAGQRVRVSWQHLDRELLLLIDGREVFGYDRQQHDPVTLDTVAHESSANVAGIGFAGGRAEVRQLAIDRDIYYTNNGALPRSSREAMVPRLKVPDGRYYMLGDNSANSSDSRLWEIKKVEVFAKPKPGQAAPADPEPQRVIWCERKGGQGRGSSYRYLTDREQWLDSYGVWQTVNLETHYTRVSIYGYDGECVGPTPIEWQTVPEELIIGRACLVFWPLFKPFRLKLIR